MKRTHWFKLIPALTLGLGLAALLLWLGATAPARAGSDVHCVNQTGMNCNAVCGGECYASLQAAVNAASTGHEIRVAAGTYAPGGTVAVITKQLVIRGGYGQSCGDDDFDPDLHQTVLDAQWGGSVISITNADAVTLTHLTLTHGDGTGNCGSDGCGGGVYATGTDLHMGNCVITNNVGSRTGGQRGMGGGIYAFAGSHSVEIWQSQIVSNTANTDSASIYDSMGGGVCVRYGTVILRENQILDNVGSSAGTGGRGGGVYLDVVNPCQVLTNTVRGNKASITVWGSDGGGIYLANSTCRVAGNRIENNWTNPSQAGRGGGVMILYGEVHLDRNIIISNSTGIGSGWVRPGGGVYIASRGPVTLSNNLIADNDAGSYGGGVFVRWHIPPASRALLVNNTIVNNGDSGVVGQSYAVLTMTNNIIAGHGVGLGTLSPFTGTVIADHNLFWNTADLITGTNAILQDPLLTADYHLRTGSPAVDAGVTITWLTDDLDGNPRPQGSRYDIGAYEGTWSEVFLPLVLRNH